MLSVTVSNKQVFYKQWNIWTVGVFKLSLGWNANKRPYSLAHWHSHHCCVFQLHSDLITNATCFRYVVMELLEGGVFITNAVCFSYTRMWWWNCWKGVSCCLASSASSFSRKLRPWTSWTSWCVLLTSCTAKALCIVISNLRWVVCPFFLPSFLPALCLSFVCVWFPFPFQPLFVFQLCWCILKNKSILRLESKSKSVASFCCCCYWSFAFGSSYSSLWYEFVQKFLILCHFVLLEWSGVHLKIMVFGFAIHVMAGSFVFVCLKSMFCWVVSGVCSVVHQVIAELCGWCLFCCSSCNYRVVSVLVIMWLLRCVCAVHHVITEMSVVFIMWLLRCLCCSSCDYWDVCAGHHVITEMSVLVIMWLLRCLCWSSCDYWDVCAVHHVITEMSVLFIMWSLRCLWYSSCDYWDVCAGHHVITEMSVLFIMWSLRCLCCSSCDYWDVCAGHHVITEMSVLVIMWLLRCLCWSSCGCWAVSMSVLTEPDLWEHEGGCRDQGGWLWLCHASPREPDVDDAMLFPPLLRPWGLGSAAQLQCQRHHCWCCCWIWCFLWPVEFGGHSGECVCVCVCVCVHFFLHEKLCSFEGLLYVLGQCLQEHLWPLLTMHCTWIDRLWHDDAVLINCSLTGLNSHSIIKFKHINS